MAGEKKMVGVGIVGCGFLHSFKNGGGDPYPLKGEIAKNPYPLKGELRRLKGMTLENKKFSNAQQRTNVQECLALGQTNEVK
jgi:hypothetical protein